MFNSSVLTFSIRRIIWRPVFHGTSCGIVCLLALAEGGHGENGGDVRAGQGGDVLVPSLGDHALGAARDVGCTGRQEGALTVRSDGLYSTDPSRSSEVRMP